MAPSEFYVSVRAISDLLWLSWAQLGHSRSIMARQKHKILMAPFNSALKLHRKIRFLNSGDKNIELLSLIPLIFELFEVLKTHCDICFLYLNTFFLALSFRLPQDSFKTASSCCFFVCFGSVRVGATTLHHLESGDQLKIFFWSSSSSSSTVVHTHTYNTPMLGKSLGDDDERRKQPSTRKLRLRKGLAASLSPARLPTHLAKIMEIVRAFGPYRMGYR